MEIIHSRYKILQVLGQGGIGTTYKAEDLQTNQFIAIKIISFHQITDWKTVELFEREVRVLKQLDHPAIPKYLDSFEIDTVDDRLFCIVQALAPGKNLAQLMQEGWRPDEDTVKAIAQQLLEICIYLQTLTPPIIHRDIKPQNILRDEHGQIYLVDFGAVQDTYRQTVTGGSTVVGTFGYMAPEQFRGQATRATDLYGLGTTLVFLLTGKDPINLQQTDELKIIIPNSLQVSLPFRRWLQHLIDPAVEDRCQSAEAAILFFQGQEEILFSKNQSIFRPQTTKIKFIKTEHYLRLYFLPHNIFHPKIFRSLLLGFIGIIMFVIICIWLLFSGTLIPSFLNNLLQIMYLVFVVAIGFACISSIQLLIKPTVLIANKQFITLKGMLKPFRLYQEVTFGLDYIDEIHINKSSQKNSACLIKTINQENFKFGDYLSLSEQRWIIHEIQEFIGSAKKCSELVQLESDKLFTNQTINALDTILTQGISCYQENLIGHAECLFKSAIIIDPKSVEAHNNLGVIQYQKGQYLDAIESFHFALRFAPSYWAAMVNLAQAYATYGDFDSYIKTYTNPCPMGQKKGNDKHTIILVCDTRQSISEAINSLQELNPNGGILEVQTNYAYLLQLQGHLEAAICTYKDALKLAEQGTLFLDICIDKHAHKKNISEFYANFGWALAMAGQYDDALDNLKRSYRSLKSGSNTSQKVNALIKHYQQRSPSIKRI